MTTVTIIIQNAPYKDDNKAWHALRFAGAALTDDMSGQVHLLDDAVYVGRKEHQVPEGKSTLKNYSPSLLNVVCLCVRACGMAVDDCGVTEDELIAGIEKGSMKALAGWVKTSDHVITF